MKALDVDPTDNDSNYYLGLLNLYGLGIPTNVELAYDYFTKSEKDHRSLNALGYIYITAPILFDMTDPLKNQ